jgi:aryl-alcohol dehydrogenase-like predicted oxidoreductase
VEYIRLGRCGLTASRIALGMTSFGSPTWRPWEQLDETAAEPIVRRAAEAGITFFDTGNHYSGGASEQITGRLLAKIFTRRDEYVLATKVGAVLGPGPHQRGLSRKHILAAVEDSLRRLGTDHIDLYQIHRWDPDTPVEETIEALHDLARSGKVRYLGAGSMYAWQFATAHHAAQQHGGPTFISMQNHYNLAYREEEREMIPLCRHLGVGVIPWSPLARGLLTGTRRRHGEPRTLRAASDDYARQLYDADDATRWSRAQTHRATLLRADAYDCDSTRRYLHGSMRCRCAPRVAAMTASRSRWEVENGGRPPEAAAELAADRSPAPPAIAVRLGAANVPAGAGRSRQRLPLGHV